MNEKCVAYKDGLSEETRDVLLEFISREFTGNGNKIRMFCSNYDFDDKAYTPNLLQE